MTAFALFGDWKTLRIVFKPGKWRGVHLQKQTSLRAAFAPSVRLKPALGLGRFYASIGQNPVKSRVGDIDSVKRFSERIWSVVSKKIALDGD